MKKPEKVKNVNDFLKKFPKYSSHYSPQNSTLYFHPHLTKKKMYDMYLEIHSDYKVSFSKFLQIFKEYKVKIYVPRKDTCSTCDKQQAARKSGLTSEEILLIEKESNEHKERVQA